MEIALDLARKCSGFTFPNPPVGCVIVEYDKIKKDHKIVSYGQTQISGRPHAEFNAIKQTFLKQKKIIYATHLLNLVVIKEDRNLVFQKS